MKGLSEIKAEINRLASRVGAPQYVLPTYGCTEDGARPHIEADSQGYHYVVVERGQELQRNTTRDIDELLYRVFESVTFNLACDYERMHRAVGQDFRRMLFSRQVELLSSLSLSWAERKSHDHLKILQQHPFDDE